MDAQIRERTCNAVKRIFDLAGYETECLDSVADLSAVKGAESVLILCSDDRSEIEKFDLTPYRIRSGGDDRECRKLVVSFEYSSEAPNSVVWGLEEIVRRSGEATVAEIFAKRLVIDIDALSYERSLPVRTEPEPLPLVRERVYAPDNVPVDGGIIDTEEEKIYPDEDEDDIAGPEIPHLEQRISGKKAIGIAGFRGDVEVIFVPHWYFHFQSTGEDSYKDKLVSYEADEEGLINAVNNMKTTVSSPEILYSPVPFGSNIKNASLQREDAEKKILEEMMEMVSKRIRVRYEKGDTIFYEDRLFAPKSGDVSLTMEEIYLPVIKVTNESRIAEINGYTGEKLKEPVDEGVEVF